MDLDFAGRRGLWRLALPAPVLESMGRSIPLRPDRANEFVCSHPSQALQRKTRKLPHITLYKKSRVAYELHPIC